MIMRASIIIKYKYYFAFLVVPFLFLSNCSEEPPSTYKTFNLTIHGRVVDAESLSPIANATVGMGQDLYNPWHGYFSIGLQIVTTNENGEYRFDPEPITYCDVHEISVTVSKERYKHNSDCDFICIEEVQICDFALVR